MHGHTSLGNWVLATHQAGAEHSLRGHPWQESDVAGWIDQCLEQRRAEKKN